MTRDRYKKEYLASFIQRWSGVVLALFLPVHFWVLGMAVEGSMDSFLSWTDMPLVKLAEAALVSLLAVHLFGGLRILVIEFFRWEPWQGTLVVLAGGTSFVFGLLFLIRAL